METHKSVFPFICDNPDCSAKYDIRGFSDVLLLWGIIYLTDNRHNLIGMTCPNCHHTTVRKFEASVEVFSINEVSETLRKTVRGCVAKPDIEYVVPFSVQILEKFSQIEKNIVEQDMNSSVYAIPYRFTPIVDYPEYIKDQLPILIYENSIPKLLEIENQQKLKVFPRIVDFLSIYKTVDFVLKFDSQLVPMKDKTKNNILISFMRKAFMDYSKVSFDPFLPTSFLHMMKHNLSEEILRDMDFSGFGLENEAFDEIIQSFLFDFKKIRNRIDFELIFKDELAGKYAQKLYLNKGSDKWRQNFRKYADYMARKGGMLYEEADSKEAQTVGRSFIETQQIRKSKDNKTLADSENNKYAFVSEEITWKIKFDGKVLAGLRTKGFRYIYYLVCNQGKLFDVFSLYTLDAGSKNINSDASPENKDKEDPPPNRNKKKAHVDEIGDLELKKIYKNRIGELELKLNEAERAGDDKIYKETESELIRIKKLYNEDFKQGKSRRFDDGTLKVRRAIAKSISRAIDELEGKKSADRNPFRKKVASHFREALKPISIYDMKYDPKEKIDWFLH